MLLFVLTVCLAGVSDVLSAGSCREAGLCCPGRDASCVVQKAPINAIIEDLTDRPCYCDHACLKLGDCCTDFKAACGVVDCEVSQWGAWTDCDVECGPGSTSRTRSVLRQPHNGGHHCPALVQRRGCQGTRCPKGSPVRETALLLPARLSVSRHANRTNDIRKNLRLRYPKPPLQARGPGYCAEFRVVKATKACRQDPDFNIMREGDTICALCEEQARRESLGYRCLGDGIVGKHSRWSNLAAPHCHGRWTLQTSPTPGVPCSCKKGANYIFV